MIPFSREIMGVPHPIPYQGRKRWIGKAIVSSLPEGCVRLIEPFAGSAAVTLAAAYYGRAQRFWMNDINAPLMELWRAIAKRPDELADRYEFLWNSQKGRERTFYDEVRADFNRQHHPDAFLYLLARCVKAAIRYNTKGEFNNSPDNRRKGAHPQTMRRHILSAAALLGGRTDLTASDYREVLDAARSTDVIYMDPPYQGVCRNRDQRYVRGVTFGEFVAALKGLNARRVPFIVSYDGRTGDKAYGQPLPESLHLLRLELDAGRSTQATLLGRAKRTYECLYLSPALMAAIGQLPPALGAKPQQSTFAFSCAP
jgi:DNA adenine methylase